MMDMKCCSSGEHCLHPEAKSGWLPATLDYFYADKNASCGLRSCCKYCHSAGVTRTQNKARKNEAVKRYAAAHPEVLQKATENFKRNHPGKVAEYCRDWYWRNVEEQRERIRTYKQENQERLLEWTREYQRTHPEIGRLNNQRRAARRKSLPATLTGAEWEYALDYFGHRCAVCGRAEGDGYHLAADHWIPLKSGSCPGTTRLNIVPLCHSMTKGVYGACNNSKSFSDPNRWLIRRFGEESALEIVTRVESYFGHLRSLETR